MARRDGADSAKRAPLNLRTTTEMRDRLEASANARGLSITQEANRRLEASFNEEERLDLESGRAATNFLSRMIRGSIASIEAKTKKEWKDDPRTATLCEGAIMGVVEILMTPLVGEGVANRLIGETDEEARAKLLETGRSVGRVFAQDRLSDQVKKLDEGAWSDE